MSKLLPYETIVKAHEGDPEDVYKRQLQHKALSAPRTNGGHLSDIHPPEIEIEIGRAHV